MTSIKLRYILRSNRNLSGSLPLGNINFDMVFQKHFASLVKSKYESLAAKSNKDHVEKTGLITMSQWACYLNVDSCVNKAKEEMSKLIQNPDYK